MSKKVSDRDKFLTEKMGLCWHDWFYKGTHPPYRDPEFKPDKICSNCGIDFYKQLSLGINECNFDFSTPEGFFKLWNWAAEQDWWQHFIERVTVGHFKVRDIISIINPTVFADEVWGYLSTKRIS